MGIKSQFETILILYISFIRVKTGFLFTFNIALHNIWKFSFTIPLCGKIENEKKKRNINILAKISYSLYQNYCELKSNTTGVESYSKCVMFIVQHPIPLLHINYNTTAFVWLKSKSLFYFSAEDTLLLLIFFLFWLCNLNVKWSCCVPFLTHITSYVIRKKHVEFYEFNLTDRNEK